MRIHNTNCALKTLLCEWGGGATQIWSQLDVGLSHMNWCKFRLPHAHVLKIITYCNLFGIPEVHRFDVVQPPNVAFKLQIIINCCACDVRKLDTIWHEQILPISYTSPICDCQLLFFLVLLVLWANIILRTPSNIGHVKRVSRKQYGVTILSRIIE